MHNIILIWEMGAELGHITRLKELAEKLCQKGHNVTFILNTPSLISALPPHYPTTPFNVIQAPAKWTKKSLKLSRKPANFSEILIANGYHKTQELTDQIQEWQQLLTSLNADLIIFDYAPTAILASRGLLCKKMSLDDPFSKPPNSYPLPIFSMARNVSINNLRISDDKLVNIVNKALCTLHIPPIKFAYDIFHVDRSILLSIEEVDPYANQRENTKYYGPISSNNLSGASLTWSANPKTKKVFAYLKPDYPKLDELLDALSQLNIEAHIYIPSSTLKGEQGAMNNNKAPNIRISNTPYILDSSLQSADLLICHGGHSTTLNGIINGLPVLLIPLQQEQFITTQRCIDSGLGRGLNPHEGVKTIIPALLDLIETPHYRENARECQLKYQSFAFKPALDHTLEQAEKLLGSS